MNVEFSVDLNKKLKKIKKTNPLLTDRIEKQLAIFLKNPQHPSLRLHKLSGELDNLWSISITKSVRMVYILEGETAYFVDIGTHNEVYK